MPTRTLRCVLRPGCGRAEEERRLAGAGLGGATQATELAEAAGQPMGRQAAPPAATVGSGGEWTQKWRVPRGSPDWRPRPPTLLRLMLLDLGLDPGGRREELSASSMLSLMSISSAGRRPGAPRSGSVTREGRVVGVARRDAVTVLQGFVVAAAAISSGTPRPPTPSLVGLPVTTTPSTNLEQVGQPPSEAERELVVVMTMASIPVASAVAKAMKLVPMTMTVLVGGMVMICATIGSLAVTIKTR